MKRIKDADINFKVNPKRINLKNFSMRFYTVNSQLYFFIKDQDDLVSVEREATIYDDPEVIISGGTVAVDYYLPLDWSELVQLGEGVLNYRCINNIEDPFFPDFTYNQVVEDTTGYYIDSDIHVDPAQDKDIIKRLAEVEARVGVEQLEREEADTAISGAVDSEVARAISAETELSERIDAIESGTSEALDAEIERAISAETALQDAIDAEEARAIAQENAIRQDLTDETELRTSADTVILATVNDEIVRSTSADTALDNKIDVETLRAIGVENAISGNLETYKATNNAALQAETTRATSAETSLGNAIEDEVTARANADAALGTRIDNLSSASTAAIEAEEARAQEAESGLTNAINNEVTRATSAETIIANSLNGEITRATSAETALNNQIDAEVLRATAAEADLEAKIGVVSGATELINAETARAVTAENALSGAIDSVSAATSGSVEELDAKIDTVSGNVITETTRATTAEEALSGAIDTLDARFFDDAKYEDSGNTKVINFYNDNVVKATIDCTDFLVDGMIDDVYIENGYLVIDFNTASGKQDIRIPLTDIFNPANYYTKSETSGATEIANALALKLNITDFNTYSGAVDTVINSKAAQTTVDALSGTVTAHTSDSTIHLTSGDVQTQIDSSISGKANSSDVYLKTETSGATELTTAFEATQPKLSAGTGISIDANNVISSTASITIDPTLDSGSTNPVANSAITSSFNNCAKFVGGAADGYGVSLNGNEGSGNLIGVGMVKLKTLNGSTTQGGSTTWFKVSTINGKKTLSTQSSNVADFQLVETSAITSAVTSASTDSEIPSAKAVYDALGSAGGGKAIEAGRGISVITGETADTVSFNLPISAGTGNNSIKCGGNCIATKNYSAAFGNNSSAKGQNAFAINQSTANGQDSFSQGISHAEKSFSAAFGRVNYSKNDSELSCGQFNNSVSATTTFGDSGNTLFSVGNGTSNSARHNAFEIRQNGDIYLTKDGQDVKLQDQLGGGSIEVSSAITSGDTNAVAGGAVYDRFDEVEQVTAQALNVLNDRVSEDEEVTAAALVNLNEALSGKQNQLVAGANITISGNVISATASGGGISSAECQTMISQAVSGKADTSYVDQSVSGKADSDDVYTKSETMSTSEIDNALYDKQDRLSAGNGIDISDMNEISVTIPVSAGSGDYSVIEGYYTRATSTAAHAEGYETEASGDNSHAEGQGTFATFWNSHAEGNGTSATSWSSHAEGSGTTAEGQCSHAEGANTDAQGYTSHAEGSWTTAYGTDSHAEGGFTRAGSDFSHAEGYQTETQNLYEHASGVYNVSISGSSSEGDSGNTLFTVGNGYDYNTKHNALDIRQNGDIYIANTSASGAYYEKPMIKLQDALGQGGGISSAQCQTMIDNSISGKTNQSDFTGHTTNSSIHVTTAQTASWNGAVTDIATVSASTASNTTALGGLKLVKLSQSEYNNLQNKDNSTLYVIVG